mgnify:CR=1 FL=1
MIRHALKLETSRQKAKCMFTSKRKNSREIAIVRNRDCGEPGLTTMERLASSLTRQARNRTTNSKKRNQDRKKSILKSVTAKCAAHWPASLLMLPVRIQIHARAVKGWRLCSNVRDAALSACTKRFTPLCRKPKFRPCAPARDTARSIESVTIYSASVLLS